MMITRSRQTRKPRNYIANTARRKDTLQTTVTSETKIHALIVDDSTTKPRTAGIKTSRSRTRARGREAHVNVPETKRQMSQMTTRSSHPL